MPPDIRPKTCHGLHPKRLLSLHGSIESMYPEIESSGDDDLLQDLENELLSGEKSLEELEIRRMFTREEDKCSCFLSHVVIWKVEQL